MSESKGLIGTVLSDKMQKTRVVRVMRQAKHPKYGRIVRKYNKFKVHDEKNLSHTGDTVRIRQTRPLSKEKCFYLVEVVKKLQAQEIQIKEVEV